MSKELIDLLRNEVLHLQKDNLNLTGEITSLKKQRLDILNEMFRLLRNSDNIADIDHARNYINNRLEELESK